MSELSKAQIGSDTTVLSESADELDESTVSQIGSGPSVQSEHEDTVLSEGEETVEEAEEPTAPAPRRSSRVRSNAHLRPDFVYDFALQSSNSTPEQRETLQKMNSLKEIVKLF